MKNCFIAMRRGDKKGSGLEPHDHPLLKGKEFTSQGEAIATLSDHLRETPREEREEASKQIGEVILIQSLQF